MDDSQVSRDDLGRVDNKGEMAPKNHPDEGCESSSHKMDANNLNEDEIAEIQAVNESLDSLSSALDMIEERTDGIKAKLLELLNSNKEIRESIIAENARGDEHDK